MDVSLARHDHSAGFVEVQAAGGIDLGYEFDEVGNLKRLRTADQSEPPLRAYGYDGLNRLTQSQNGSTSVSSPVKWTLQK